MLQDKTMIVKKWLKYFFIFFIISFIITGSFNFIVDPFQQFRVHTFYPIYFEEKNERYKNAGFIKNYDYDSVILGTSVTENFIISEVKEILGYRKLIKLCVSGGSGKELSVSLKTSIDNTNLKNVLWGLDILSFSGKPDRLMFGEGSFPFYLYENSYLSLYKYLFSVDTIFESIKAVSNQYVKSKNDPLFDFNRMYQWQHIHEKNFTLNNVFHKWKNRSKAFSTISEQRTFDYLKNNFDTNFLKLLKNNPTIKFKIFFPPYSILFFLDAKKQGLLEDFLLFKIYIVNEMSSLENVEIYDFQDDKDITHNLANYRDLTHYHQNINSRVVKQIRDNENKITKENAVIKSQNLKKQVREFDVDQAFKTLKAH